MSWAETFNSSAAGKRFSNKMANIKLDPGISQAEIEAKIKEHEKKSSDGDSYTLQTEQKNASGLNTYSNSTPVINQNNNYQYQGYAKSPVEYAQGVGSLDSQHRQAAPQMQYQRIYSYPMPSVQQYQTYRAPAQYAQTQSL